MNAHAIKIMPSSMKCHDGFGPQLAQDRDLFFHALATAVETHPHRRIFNGVPSHTNTQPQTSTGHHVNCCSLLGDEDRGAAWEDDDPRDQFYVLRDAAKQSKEDKGFLHRTLADDALVRKDMAIAQRFRGLGVGASGTRIAPNPGLRKHDTDPHLTRLLSTTRCCAGARGTADSPHMKPRVTCYWL